MFEDPNMEYGENSMVREVGLHEIGNETKVSTQQSSSKVVWTNKEYTYGVKPCSNRICATKSFLTHVLDDQFLLSLGEHVLVLIEIGRVRRGLMQA